LHLPAREGFPPAPWRDLLTGKLVNPTDVEIEPYGVLWLIEVGEKVQGEQSV